MQSWISTFVLVAPALLVLVALVATGQAAPRPRALLRGAAFATTLAFGVAVCAAFAVVALGPTTSPLLGVGGFGLSVRLDAVSAVMLLLVSFIGLIVARFSRNYLDGDARQGYFVGALCLTLASVLLFVMAGNLVHLVAAWMATSLSLHRLLLFYRDRPAAIVAARKKFITARIGDVCLITAATLLAVAFGSTDIATLLSAAREMAPGEMPSGVSAATLLIAVAALLKSAQFPTHGWLPEVMETPTPVSALLHAGIINAGGFLVIRLADVMLLSTPSLHLLAFVGGFTALFGGVVMLTQTSVKVSLAWSTVSQMGFMLLQCGLGVFPLAVLHIVAHSLYKAHAFLSSGSVVEIARSAWIPNLKTKPRALHLVASLLIALAMYVGVGQLFQGLTSDSLAVLALGGILVMGVTLLIAQSMHDGSPARVVSRVVVAAGGVTVSYFALQAAAFALLGSSFPPIPALNALDRMVIAFAVMSFAVVTVLQLFAPVWSGNARWNAARVHLANGLYVNAMFNRLVGALNRRTVAQR